MLKRHSWSGKNSTYAYTGITSARIDGSHCRAGNDSSHLPSIRKRLCASTNYDHDYIKDEFSCILDIMPQLIVNHHMIGFDESFAVMLDPYGNLNLHNKYKKWKSSTVGLISPPIIQVKYLLELWHSSVGSRVAKFSTIESCLQGKDHTAQVIELMKLQRDSSKELLIEKEESDSDSTGSRNSAASIHRDHVNLSEMCSEYGLSSLYAKFRDSEVTSDVLFMLKEKVIDDEVKLNGVEKTKYYHAKSIYEIKYGLSPLCSSPIHSIKELNPSQSKGIESCGVEIVDPNDSNKVEVALEYYQNIRKMSNNLLEPKEIDSFGVEIVEAEEYYDTYLDDWEGL